MGHTEWSSAASLTPHKGRTAMLSHLPNNLIVAILELDLGVIFNLFWNIHKLFTICSLLSWYFWSVKSLLSHCLFYKASILPVAIHTKITLSQSMGSTCNCQASVSSILSCLASVPWTQVPFPPLLMEVNLSGRDAELSWRCSTHIQGSCMTLRLL